MSDSGGRNPYLGLLQAIDRRSDERKTNILTIGKVLSIDPIRVLADGMTLEREDLRIAQHLTVQEARTKTVLPEKRFVGFDSIGGPCWVQRPSEDAYGRPTFDGAEPGALLRVGDEVLVLRSWDGQTYYVIERMVMP